MPCSEYQDRDQCPDSEKRASDDDARCRQAVAAMGTPFWRIGFTVSIVLAMRVSTGERWCLPER